MIDGGLCGQLAGMVERFGKDQPNVVAAVEQVIPEAANKPLVAAGTRFRVYDILNVSVLRIHRRYFLRVSGFLFKRAIIAA